MQRFAHLLTEKAIDTINIGLMEMAQLSQNTFTPDFVLIGMLQQEESLLVSVFERMKSGDKYPSSRLGLTASPYLLILRCTELID